MEIAEPVQRFSFYERAVHWMAVIVFMYAALTGLALWSPRLFWLSGVLGGGDTVRSWHPWAGVIFAALLGCMFLVWARQMGLDADDRRWLRRAHRYAVHDDEGLPEADRFNAGQKMLFWVQIFATVLLLLSGIVLWFPESMARGWRVAAILIHPATAIVSLGTIMIHLYMGTAATPGAFRGMVQGWVDPGWAATHHPKWYRKISRR